MDAWSDRLLADMPSCKEEEWVHWVAYLGT